MRSQYSAIDTESDVESLSVHEDENDYSNGSFRLSTEFSVNSLKKKQRQLTRWLWCSSGLLLASVVTIIALAANVGQFRNEFGTMTLVDTSPHPPNMNQELYNTIKSNINNSYDPCEDFYMYACGSWLTRTEIPGDASTWARSFSEIQKRNQEILKEQAESKWPVLGTFYDNCMDNITIDARKATPIQNIIQTTIDPVQTIEDFFIVIAKFYKTIDIHLLFSFDIGSDPTDVTHNIVEFAQGGLSMPSRKFYVGEDKQNKLIVYNAHVTRMLQLLGDSDNEAPVNAKTIVDFEREIALFSENPADLRDPLLTNNPKDLSELQVMAPNIPWQVYFEELHVNTSVSHFKTNVESPQFFQHLNDLIVRTPISTLKQYARWKILHATADDLSEEFATENFQFFGKIIVGQTERKPRWKKCVSAADNFLGEMLGRYYVMNAFPGQSRQIAADMIERIKSAFGENLKNLDWMDDAAKQAAQTKLNMMDDLVGYPKDWKDYSSVFIKPGDYFDNLVQLRIFEFNEEIEKLEKPPNKKDWLMTPPTVNAYYAPDLNTINFPAGILQPPFFNMSYPVAVNMAGIGMVMGHEITHGFDDQGSNYDGTGKLSPWWNKATTDKFNERAMCLKKQYSEFQVLGLHQFVNGNLTIGENIADNGGIKEAYTALQGYYKQFGEDLPIHKDISNDQLFFLSYAQDWCQVSTAQYAEMLLLVDVHSPARARVNLPLRNFPKFGEAFKCKIGSFMRPHPRDVCTVW